MRSDWERLRDISDAIDKIEQYILRGKIEYDADELVQVWVRHYILIIGEAASGISEGTQSHFMDIPWKKLSDIRDYLLHDYFQTDPRTIWIMANRDIPKLKEQLLEAINSF